MSLRFKRAVGVEMAFFPPSRYLPRLSSLGVLTAWYENGKPQFQTLLWKCYIVHEATDREEEERRINGGDRNRNLVSLNTILADQKQHGYE